MAEYFNQLRRLLQAQGESFEEDVRKLVIHSIIIILGVKRGNWTQADLDLDLAGLKFQQTDLF